MKKTIMGSVAALALAAPAFAADEVTLQLKWVTQAQFAGYYVALDQGFYAEEDLDVTIKPGGPDIAPPQVVAGGGADVLVEWMPAALAAREKGRNAKIDSRSTRKPIFSRYAPALGAPQGRQQTTKNGTKNRRKKTTENYQKL